MARQTFPGWNQVLMAGRRRIQPELCITNGKEISLKGWCNLKQKLTILAMVVLATIFIATPVLAAGSSRTMLVAKKWNKPTVISMTGTIVDLAKDPVTGEDRIRIKIQMTNRAFIQYRGETVWVFDASTTKYFLWDGTTRSPWSYDLLSIDDKISINARVIGGVFKARRVQVNQPRIPQ